MQAGQEVWRRRRHLSTSLLGVQGTLKQRSERKSVSRAGKRNQDVLSRLGTPCSVGLQ